MTLEAGKQLGHYKIIGSAGAGGMGEVYKATDTRLDRTVAIKVLHTRVANNQDIKDRFEREAKVIAGLNHPNICVLHDIGSEEDVDYLVMEYIEGETLSKRLEEGPLTADDILNIAIQIADALDKAHKQGLVHRDLKPGNIMLTKEGAKLLDFGLAKLQPEPGFIDDLSSGNTRTTPLTTQGAIIGTLQYMSPEQLEGQEATERSDIFAFGATLYEMATGKTAFEGKSRASLIASVLKEQPRAVSEITPLTPMSLERVIKQCLAKEPEQRWQSSGDLKRSLELIRDGGALPSISGASGRVQLSAKLAWAVAGAALLVAAWFVITSFTSAGPDMKVRRLLIPFGENMSGIYWPRFSPDGRNIAFRASDSTGVPMIWIRPINSLEPFPLQGTKNITDRPFWSPDSKFIAFFDGDQLKKLPIGGGPAQTICRATNGHDGTWGNESTIIFDGGLGDSLRQVSAGGGSPQAATRLISEGKEQYHGWPWFLPNGKDFLFVVGDTAATPTGNMKLKVGKVGSFETKELIRVDSRVEYAEPGYLLYVRDKILVAHPFDSDNLEFTGDPSPLDDEVMIINLGSNFSAADDGSLAYQKGTATQRNMLIWVDRVGNVVDTVGEPSSYRDIAVSPDESRMAYVLIDQQTGTEDIWVHDLRRNVPSRLTFDDGQDLTPLWSADGKHIYFMSNREGGFKVLRRQASGLGKVETVFAPENGGFVIPGGWMPDGQTLLINLQNESPDIISVNTTDGTVDEELLVEPFAQFTTSVTRDGRFMAYVSDESGRNEVYVRELSPAGGKWQISTDGAEEVIWATGDKELVYRTDDGTFMAVSIDIYNEFQAGIPVKLFQRRVDTRGWERSRFHVSPDGQRFLLNVRTDDDTGGEFVVTLNWYKELMHR